MVSGCLYDCVPPFPTLYPPASMGESLPWSCLGECKGNADAVTEEHGKETYAHCLSDSVGTSQGQKTVVPRNFCGE